MSNMDILAFLVSAIIAAVVTIWIASGNNKVGNYGVGENDLPTTKSPGLPRTRTFNCSPPEGSKPKNPLRQGGSIGTNPKPTSEPPLAPGESIKEKDNECICSCDNIGVLSAVKKSTKIDDEKEVDFVEIILICHHCGRTKKETKYLYGDV